MQHFQTWRLRAALQVNEMQRMRLLGDARGETRSGSQPGQAPIGRNVVALPVSLLHTTQRLHFSM